MKLRVILNILCVVLTTTFTMAQNADKRKDSSMTVHASGTFEVKLASQNDKSGNATLSRMIIDKQFHGDLEGVSKGQMLAGAQP